MVRSPLSATAELVLMVLLQNCLLVVCAVVFTMLLLSVLYWLVVILKDPSRQTGQWSDSISKPFYKPSPKNSVNLQFVNNLISTALNLPQWFLVRFEPSFWYDLAVTLLWLVNFRSSI